MPRRNRLGQFVRRGGKARRVGNPYSSQFATKPISAKSWQRTFGPRRGPKRALRRKRDALGHFLPVKKPPAYSRIVARRRARQLVIPFRKAAAVIVAPPARARRLGPVRRKARVHYLGGRNLGRRKNYFGGGKCIGILYRKRVQKRTVAKKRIARGASTRGRIRWVRRNPQQQLIATNPGIGGILMPTAVVVNPRRRRRHRRNPGRSATVINRRHRRRRRRNPAHNPRGLSIRNPLGMISNAVPSLLGGGVGGAIAGFLDTKFLSDKPMLSVLSKLGIGITGAFVLRKRPALGAGFAGGMMGALGYSAAIKLGGGLVAGHKIAALQGLADMAADDPELAALITDGSLQGLVEGGDPGLADPDLADAAEYATSLGDEDD